MELIIYLDADSLPLKHREIILKRCIKENIITFFVADRELKDVKNVCIVQPYTIDKYLIILYIYIINRLLWRNNELLTITEG